MRHLKVWGTTAPSSRPAPTPTASPRPGRGARNRRRPA